MYEALEEFYTSPEVEGAAAGAGLDAKTMAVKTVTFLAERFNRANLYLAINPHTEARNRKIIHLRENKKLTLEQIANILGVSTGTVHSVVINKNLVTISGDFEH